MVLISTSIYTCRQQATLNKGITSLCLMRSASTILLRTRSTKAHVEMSRRLCKGQPPPVPPYVDRDSERDGERREKKVREPHLLPARYSMPAPSSSTLEIRHAALVLCFSSNPMRHQACKGDTWRGKKQRRESKRGKRERR